MSHKAFGEIILEERIEFETSVIVLCSYSSYSETKRDITREKTKRRSFKEKQR